MTFFVTAQRAFHHCTFCASLHVKTSPASQQRTWAGPDGLSYRTDSHTTATLCFRTVISSLLGMFAKRFYSFQGCRDLFWKT